MKSSLDPRILVALAFELLKRHEQETAIEIGKKALELANETVHFSPYIYTELVHLILRLFQFEKIESVLSLFSLLEETWENSGQEALHISDLDAAQWILLQEYVRVIWDFPTPVRKLLAKAILRMDFESSEAALELSAYISKNKRRMRWVRKHTEVYAPNIDAILSNMAGQRVVDTDGVLYWQNLKYILAVAILASMTRNGCRSWCEGIETEDNAATKSNLVEDKDTTSGQGPPFFDYRDANSSMQPP